MPHASAKEPTIKDGFFDSSSFLSTSFILFAPVRTKTEYFAPLSFPNLTSVSILSPMTIVLCGSPCECDIMASNIYAPGFPQIASGSFPVAVSIAFTMGPAPGINNFSFPNLSPASGFVAINFAPFCIK